MFGVFITLHIVYIYSNTVLQCTYHRVRAYPKFKGTHKDQQDQLLTYILSIHKLLIEANLLDA